MQIPLPSLLQPKYILFSLFFSILINKNLISNKYQIHLECIAILIHTTQTNLVHMDRLVAYLSWVDLLHRIQYPRMSEKFHIDLDLTTPLGIASKPYTKHRLLSTT